VGSGRACAPSASHEVAVPLRVSRREPYRLFGSPVPPRRSFRSPSRCSGSRLPPPPLEGGASSHRLQSLFRDPIRRRPSASRRSPVARAFRASSHEVPGPSSG
jgi:hypothetical protein